MSESALSNRTLKVRAFEYLGRVTIYPECEVSRVFVELLGQKTLTPRDVELIKELGYKFEVIQNEVKL